MAKTSFVSEANPFPRPAVLFFLFSAAASLAAQMLGFSVIAVCFAAAAVLVSGWALVGHLITLDDDAPGEFSNPENDPQVWRNSVRELLIKLTIFVVLSALFAWYVVEIA